MTVTSPFNTGGTVDPFDSETIDLGPDSNDLLPPFGETNFDRISKLLQATDTKIIYIGVPDPRINYQRRIWNLSGNYSGKEGLELGPHLQGLMHAVFELLLSSGAYELGATYQRTNWMPRPIKMSVQVNGDLTDSQTTSFRYRMLEDRWWNSWSDEADGWIGVWTRTHGWRFIKCRLANESKTAFEIDPTSNDNNFMQWDMDVICLYPYYAKKAFTDEWTNQDVNSSTGWNIIEDVIEGVLSEFGLAKLFDRLLGDRHVGEGTLNVVNKSPSVKTYPQFIVSSPGIAWIQDGVNADGTPRMQQLPYLTPEDGYILVDTNPDARTITCATDPTDPLFYQILRNSQFIEVALHDIVDSGEPVWKRFKGSFTEASAIGPYQTRGIKVWHSEHGGTITAVVPQRYKMAWG